MDFKKFETLIGKDIVVANNILLKEGFENQYLLGINSYTLENTFKDFYGMPYNIISITTDDKNTINSITIHFHQVMDSNFYGSFILDYGKPTTIQVINNSKIISEGILKEESFTQYLKRGYVETREGDFEENPLFMIWVKESFQIKAFLRYEQNVSEIIFRKPTKNL